MFRTVRTALSLALLLVLVSAGLPAASAQTTYSEGPDYAFLSATLSSGLPVRVTWNLYGGPIDLPYYIHNDLIDAGYEEAVHNAFNRYEDDPTSDITFVYMGATNVLSEIRITGSLCCPQPSDDFNVVSFGALPPGAVGRGGLSGSIELDSTGAPSGTGEGHFDITLSNNVPFAVGSVAGAADVESTVMHELGHALGLDHPTTNTAAIMWGAGVEGVIKRALHPADRAGLAVIYPAADPVLPTDNLCGTLAPTIDMSTNGGDGTGTEGDDIIFGTPGNDVIDGLGGNDTICAGEGDDQVQGGPGDDVIYAQGGADRVFGAQGADLMYLGDGDDSAHGNRGNDVIWGEGGNDRIFGYANDDEIHGGDGDDRLHGNFGNDLVSGGEGDDRVFGYGDNDELSGGDGADIVGGNFGDDIITGGPGNDRLYGSDGADSVSGGEGNDLVEGNSGNDVVSGDGGNDRLDGGINSDTCHGGAGTDTATRCEQVSGVP